MDREIALMQIVKNVLEYAVTDETIHLANLVGYDPNTPSSIRYLAGCDGRTDFDAIAAEVCAEIVDDIENGG